MNEARGSVSLSRLMKPRFASLLFAILVFLLVYPFFENHRFARSILGVSFTIVLITVAYAASETHQRARITWLLVPALVGNALASVGRTGTSGMYGEVFVLLFLAYSVKLLIEFAFKQRRVSSDTIAAALCAYLLVGLAWAMAFAILETAVPGSVSFGSRQQVEPLLSRCLYFSYVTLTTLGYGDVTPRSGPAGSLAFVEALTGQLFMAVLVARLVAIQTSQRLRDEGEGEREDTGE